MRFKNIFLLLAGCCCLATATPVQDQMVMRTGKDHALFIAVDDYTNWSDLRYPVKDVGRIAAELEQQYGFTTETLANPTRKQILDKLAEYRNRNFASDGQLLVFFSGHGDFASETSEGFFIPKDGLKKDPYQDSYVPLSRLKRAVNGIPCDHILLAIDACYSGALDDRIAVRANDDPPRFGRPGANGAMSHEEIDQVVKDRLSTKTRLYFTSGGLEQTPDRSQFVDQFLTALGTSSRQEPILNYNGLRYFLGKATPTPRTGAFDGNQPGTNDFLFVRSFDTAIPREDAERARADLADWRTAETQNSCASYRAYLQKHPYGDFAPAARDKIAPCDTEDQMIAAWATAKRADDCAGYNAFENSYPNSSYVTAATARRKALNCGAATVPDNMLFIPGGTFQMGDQSGDGSGNEQPVHRVTLSDFYLSRTELTNREYADFLSARGNREQGGTEWYEIRSSRAGISGSGGSFFPKPGQDDHPVLVVSWYGAVAYCNWLSEQHRLTPVYRISSTTVTPDWSANGYRLPTEAEWEYAARSGGKKEKWAGTSTESTLRQFANYSGENDGYKGTAPVGILRANNLELADMSGNVYEWCWDWYGDDYYGKSPDSNPKGPNTGSSRVIRGGSWDNIPVNCRTAYRFNFVPAFSHFNVGFRLARSSR